MQAEPYIIGTGYHAPPHHASLNTTRPPISYIQRYSCQRKGTLGSYSTCDNMPSISPVHHELVEPGSKEFCSSVDFGNWNNVTTKYLSENDYKTQIGQYVNHLITPGSEPVISDLENGSTEYPIDSGYPPPNTNPTPWENEHPRNWTCSQVLDWLYFSVFGQDFDNAQIDNFRGMSGKELVQLKKSDFLQILRNETYAERAFNQLQHQLYQRQFDYISNNSSNLQNVINNMSINSYENNNATYPYITDMYTELEQPRTYNPNVCQYNSSDMWYTSRSDVESDGECNRSPYTSSPYPDITSKHSDDDPRRPVKRGPGRPAGRETKKKKTGNKRQRSSRLWEFIRDLLKDKDTCPRLVKWEDRDEGVFRFVQSDQVAKLWGERKANPRMTYEKLSRAMRYYYKSKVLQPVLGRRLVYKFGPSATGWRPHET